MVTSVVHEPITTVTIASPLLNIQIFITQLGHYFIFLSLTGYVKLGNYQSFMKCFRMEATVYGGYFIHRPF